MGGTEQDETVQVLTVARLSAFLDSLDPTRGNRRARGAAAFRTIISGILGDDWYAKNVSHGAHDPKTPRGYVSYDFTDVAATTRQVHRIYELCEMMLNLQVVSGFHDRMKQVQKLSMTQIESAYAELQVASILFWHGLNFRFVEKKTNPKKGEDYDFEVFRSGKVISVEAKCKFESTQINARSIGLSLKEALNQLPKDGPSSIFVKIPANWFVDGNSLAPEIERETRRFFGSVHRIVSIIYYVPVLVFDNTAVLAQHRYREIENKNCRYKYIARSLFEGFEPMKAWPTGHPRWVRLMDIIEGKL